MVVGTSPWLQDVQCQDARVEGFVTVLGGCSMSVLLARWIVRNSEVLSGNVVLELGAGLGLAGITAARYGQKCILTDKHYLIPNVQYNISLNKLVTQRESHTGEVTAEGLDWTAHEEIPQASTTDDNNCCVRLVNDKLEADVVIGADIGCSPPSLPSSLFGDSKLLMYSCPNFRRSVSCLPFPLDGIGA
ncbi:hypothetical protein CYMTET_44965 [Cymbomonas tetramitiformis]|uniref:Uncharacterized protein n=1 Tax=Cymbomonas tetramitiformis TaxID=36881 RepID=A0AAE0EYI1_9CHLO|nr:hypothetical protein CYMTET_44965 [Cymbomonas tetramitiformis]